MIALIDQYRKELEDIRIYASDTVQVYTSCIQAFCEFAKEHLNVDPIKAEGTQLVLWLAFLRQTGISYSRLGHHQYALKSFFTFLVKMNVITTNPAESLPPIPRIRGRIKPISTEDAFKLLDSFDQTTWLGKRNYTMVSLLWALGLRISELTGLRVRDFEPDHGKNIGLLLFVVDRLFHYLSCYLAHPQSPKKKRAPLFPVSENKAISNDRVQTIVKEHARKAGIEDRVTPHVLRHSFATEMYHHNVPLSAIQAMMGHDSIAETAIYIHVSDKLQQQALDYVSTSGRVSWQ
jgi:site-specific recombinase XerD